MDRDVVRRSCIAESTQTAYASYLRGIGKWLNETLADPSRFFNDDGSINVHSFTPELFETFLISRFNDSARPLKVSTLEGYRSAMKHVYRVQRLPLPVEYGQDLTAFFGGLGRIQAGRQQAGEGKPSGKEPMPFGVYEQLCHSTLQSNDSGFSHLFLITQWNLMCRSKSVQTIDTAHMFAIDDSVGIVLHKTKINQDGRGPKDPRHIYANSLSPGICWITALAIYLACHSGQQPGQLFQGSNQKVRFSKTLDRALHDTTGPKLYGTHSVRKGVATYACSGSTGGIVSVCLRCGWSLGNVQDRYFRYEAAGDQFLGRVVAGLPLNKSTFAQLPPHFLDDENDDVQQGVQCTYPALWKDSRLRPILHQCAASLVYHHQFLTQTLPPTHSLFLTYLFRSDHARRLAAMVTADESNRMRPTGIPPYISLYQQHELTRAAFEKIPGVVTQEVALVLERNGAAAGHITQDALTSTIRSVLTEAGVLTNNPAPNAEENEIELQYHQWGGAFHVVPEDFELPSTTLLEAWRLWMLATRLEGTHPTG